jgi:hypothetical protein
VFGKIAATEDLRALRKKRLSSFQVSALTQRALCGNTRTRVFAKVGETLAHPADNLAFIDP